MSDLEEESKPLLGCLLQDVAMPLDQSQQRTIALWAIKTAMVSESIGTTSSVTLLQRGARPIATGFFHSGQSSPFGLAATLVP